MGKNLYFHFYLFFMPFFSIEFFEGVSRGGPYRWSMDWSVRWSVDPVRWTGPRTGGKCFRVTPPKYPCPRPSAKDHFSVRPFFKFSGTFFTSTVKLITYLIVDLHHTNCLIERIYMFEVIFLKCLKNLY